MKALSLPISIIVIVAIAVIVLLGLAALFLTGWSPFSFTVGIESAKNIACSNFTRGDCTDDWTTIQTGHDEAPFLDDLCTMYYDAPTEAECKKICNCPGY